MIESRKCIKCKIDIIVPNLQTKYCRPCAKEENREAMKEKTLAIILTIVVYGFALIGVYKLITTII